MPELAAYSRGFGIGFSLIAAIGAQNAYVLSRGILRNHHWVIAVVCAVLDTLLIAVGILGMGTLIQAYPSSLFVMTIFGALFLFGYGLFSFRRMLTDQKLDAAEQKVSLKVAVATVLALSLLNPHVYLDTVILIGSVSVQELPEYRLAFGVGAASASFVWFFCLSFGGQWLQPWFQNPTSWRILDGVVGIIMWALAWMLVRSLL